MRSRRRPLASGSARATSGSAQAGSCDGTVRYDTHPLSRNPGPQADVSARAGRSYRVTGYLDSITIFNMKMSAKVAEIP